MIYMFNVIKDLNVLFGMHILPQQNKMRINTYIIEIVCIMTCMILIN